MDVTFEDHVAEAWGEALDLTLDGLEGVAVPAVGNVAVSPRGVLALRSSRVVVQRRLS